PADIDRELLDKTMLVIDADRPSRRWTRADAFAVMFRALPLGELWSWPLRVPGLSAIAGAAYDAYARNRTRISTWLGLAACGVPGPPGPRFVLVRLHAAHPRRAVVPPGDAGVDPSLPGAHRTCPGRDRSLRRVRDLAGQPEAGRAAAADQHPQAPLPALARGRAMK